MFLTAEEKSNLEKIRDNMLFPLFAKHNGSDFTDFETCMAFFKEYEIFLKEAMDVFLEAQKRVNDLSLELSESSDDDLNSESSSENSDDEKIKQVKKILTVKSAKLTELKNEAGSIIFNDEVKQKAANIFVNLAPVASLSLFYSKDINEKRNKYIEPAMTMEEYQNNPERVKKFGDTPITIYEKIDRTVTTEIIEKEKCVVGFTDGSSLTFETLVNPEILNQVKDDFDQKVSELSNQNRMRA